MQVTTIEEHKQVVPVTQFMDGVNRVVKSANGRIQVKRMDCEPDEGSDSSNDDDDAEDKESSDEEQDQMPLERRSAQSLIQS